MIIIGFLRGRTKEEWYEEIARRVANGDGPCAPPEYAEFRGPGVHHNFDDNDNYESDEGHKSKQFGLGAYRGRIIFLGDGTEVLTDGDDANMLDITEEDKDLESQVTRDEKKAEEGGDAADEAQSKKESKPEEKPKEKANDATTTQKVDESKPETTPETRSEDVKMGG